MEKLKLRDAEGFVHSLSQVFKILSQDTSRSSYKDTFWWHVSRDGFMLYEKYAFQTSGLACMKFGKAQVDRFII